MLKRSGIRRNVVAAGMGIMTALAASAATWADGGLRPRIVRGPDDRKDYFASSESLQTIGDSVCAFVINDMLVDNGDGSFTINAQTLADDFNPLCDGEPFATQPTAAMCTGTLIAPDIVVTAGHCLENNGVRTPAFDEFYFVFDYAVREAGVMPTTFSADQVYRGSEVLGLMNVLEGPDDWAVVRLTRPVTGRTLVTVRSSGSVTVGQSLVAIGFGAGLPMKFSDNATVQSFSNLGFEADLDIIEGNSGGPIVDAATGTLEGVVSSDLDADDYYQDGDCFRATVCPEDPICSDGFTALTSVMNPGFQGAIQAALGDAGVDPPGPGDGATDNDADGDGVLDENDFCDGTPAGANVDVDGCALGDAGADGVSPCGALGMIPLVSMMCGLGLLRRRR